MMTEGNRGQETREPGVKKKKKKHRTTKDSQKKKEKSTDPAVGLGFNLALTLQTFSN